MRETIQSIGSKLQQVLGEIRALPAFQRADLLREIGRDLLRTDFREVFEPLIAAAAVAAAVAAVKTEVQAEVARSVDALVAARIQSILNAQFDEWLVKAGDGSRRVVIRR